MPWQECFQNLARIHTYGTHKLCSLTSRRKASIRSDCCFFDSAQTKVVLAPKLVSYHSWLSALCLGQLMLRYRSCPTALRHLEPHKEVASLLLRVHATITAGPLLAILLCLSNVLSSSRTSLGGTASLLHDIVELLPILYTCQRDTHARTRPGSKAGVTISKIIPMRSLMQRASSLNNSMLAAQIGLHLCLNNMYGMLQISKCPSSLATTRLTAMMGKKWTWPSGLVCVSLK